MAVDTGAVTRGPINPSLRPTVGSIKDLLSGPHGPGSPSFHALVQQAPDYEWSRLDFCGLTYTAAVLAADLRQPWTYAESGAGAVDPAKLTPTTVKTSALTLSTSAAALNQTLQGPKAFNADKFPYIEVGFWVSQVTDYAMTIGFADAIPASAASIVSDIDTPAVATVADGAFYAIDISQTLKTAALVTIGTSTAVGKTNLPTAAPIGVPTAATFLRVRVALAGTGIISGPSTAYCFVNGALVATRQALGPDSEKLLTPVIFNGSPGGTASVMDIDYIELGQQKAGSPF